MGEHKLPYLLTYFEKRWVFSCWQNVDNDSAVKNL